MARSLAVLGEFCLVQVIVALGVNFKPLPLSVLISVSVLLLARLKKREGGLICISLIFMILETLIIKQLKIPIFVTFPSNLILQN